MSTRYLGRPSVIQPWCRSKGTVTRVRWTATAADAASSLTAPEKTSLVTPPAVKERVRRLVEAGHLRRASMSQLLRFAVTDSVEPAGSEYSDTELDEILEWRFTQPSLFDSVHRKSPFTVDYFRGPNQINCGLREAASLSQIQASLEKSLASRQIQLRDEVLLHLGSALKEVYTLENAKEILSTLGAVIARFDSFGKSDATQPLILLGLQLSCPALLAPVLSHFLSLYHTQGYPPLPISESLNLLEQLTSSLQQRLLEDKTIDLEPMLRVVAGVDSRGAAAPEETSLMSIIDWSGSGETESLIIAATKLYCLLDCHVGLRDMILFVRRRLMTTTSIKTSSARLAQAVNILVKYKKYDIAIDFSQQLLHFTKLEDVLSTRTLSELLVHDDRMTLRKSISDGAMDKILTEELQALESSFEVVWCGGEKGRHVAMKDSELWEVAPDFVDDYGGGGQGPRMKADQYELKQFLKARED